MIKLTLSEQSVITRGEVLSIGYIKEIELNHVDRLYDEVSDFISEMVDKGRSSVYAIFESHEGEDYEDLYDTILISHEHTEILEFCTLSEGHRKGRDFNFKVFEFTSWYEALEYVKLLKEGL